MINIKIGYPAYKLNINILARDDDDEKENVLRQFGIATHGNTWEINLTGDKKISLEKGGNSDVAMMALIKILESQGSEYFKNLAPFFVLARYNRPGEKETYGPPAQMGVLFRPGAPEEITYKETPEEVAALYEEAKSLGAVENLLDFGSSAMKPIHF